MLLRAALDCFRTYRIATTSLTDVAKHAGVSRATAYRAFENVSKEVDRFLCALDEAVQWRRPLVVALEQAVELPPDYFAGHGLLQQVLPANRNS